jgi:radical SAM superfamily enzyme YgiQ (UPF0313 family)
MKTLLVLTRLEPNTNPPLGMATIAAVLRENGHDVEICDPTFENKRFVFDRLARTDYGILGLNAFTMSYNLALAFAAFAKEKNPRVLTVLGGIHPTILPDQVIRDPRVDVVVTGEGEFTMLEIVRGMEKKGALADVPGLLFKPDGEPRRTPPRPLIADLDSLPFPARDLLPMEKYLKANFGRTAWAVRRPATSIVTSRGCPFRCTYCSSHLIFGRGIRNRSVRHVLDEITHLVERWGVRGLSIVDDTFIVDKKRIHEFAEGLKDRRLKVEFICNGRVDTIDREILKTLKSAGCVGIAFGVESGSRKILDSILEKGITLEEVRNAFHWSYEAGIPTDAYFMIGIPGESEAEILETLRFSRTLKAAAANFTIAIPMPGTRLHEIALQTGKIEATRWEDYDYTGRPIYTSPLISHERVRRLRKKAIREFYFRPLFVLEQIGGIRSWSDLVRKVKGFSMLLKILFKR